MKKNQQDSPKMQKLWQTQNNNEQICKTQGMGKSARLPKEK
jgi:hypothetical protein